jgi:hypothetical protein
MLHGAARLGAARRRLGSSASRPVATTAHPLFSNMVKQSVRVLAGVLLFLAGIGIGDFATTAWPGPSTWLGYDEPVATVVMQKLQKELRLTPDQVARISPIVTASCTELRLISEQRRAQRLEMLDEIGTSIAPYLSADQQSRLDDLEADWQHRPQVKRDQRIVALY